MAKYNGSVDVFLSIFVSIIMYILENLAIFVVVI